MEQFIENLINELPESPTELSEKNKKKIHQYLPVPNDFKILWADISSFGGYPSGTVLTDKGIVSKAPRLSKKEKKKLKHNEAILQIPYQIILWEYFDPSDYECATSSDNSCFVLSRDNTNVIFFNDEALKNFFDRYDRKLRSDEDVINHLIDSAIISETETINLETAVFHAAYGKDQSATGHGIYAEEVGSVLDKLHGEKSTVVGRDNAKNGPDKLVDGNPIQCKFCKSSTSSVGACFKENPQTGQKEYRYYDINTGSPMKLEVPADQYDKALDAMKHRIEQGQVPGVTDPEAAKNLIRKSKLTYAQAKNLARAGTFESITFDAVSGIINCSFAAGISSLVSFGITLWGTKDTKKARDAAIDTAINVFGPSLATNILTNQIARTGLSKTMIPLSDKIVKQMSAKTVQQLVNARRALIGQGKIYGAAASKSLAKALRSNTLVEGITFIVFSIPNTYRVATKKISSAQYTKDLVSIGASFIGSIASVYGSGLVLNSISKKKTPNKKLKTAIDYVVGAGGGMLFGAATKKIGDLFKEDDSIIATRVFNAVIVNMTIEYMLSEEEVNQLVDTLDKESKKLIKFQSKIRTSKHQYYEIQQFLNPYFENIINKRVYISKEVENTVFMIDQPAEEA